MLGSRKSVPKPIQSNPGGVLDSLFVDPNAPPASASNSSSSQRGPQSASSQAVNSLSPSTSNLTSPRGVIQPPTSHEEEEFTMRVYELVSMGFSSEYATIALKRCSNNVQDAITFCLDHDDDTMRQFIEEDRLISSIRQRNAAAPTTSRPSPSSVAATGGSVTTNPPESKSVFKRMLGMKGKERKAVTTVPADNTPEPVIVPPTQRSATPPPVNPNYHEPADMEDEFLNVPTGNRSFRVDQASTSSSVSVPPPPTVAAPFSPYVAPAAAPPATAAAPVVQVASPPRVTIYPTTNTNISTVNPTARPQSLSTMPPVSQQQQSVRLTKPAAPIDPYAAAMAKIHQIRQQGEVSSSVNTTTSSAAVSSSSSAGPVPAPAATVSKSPLVVINTVPSISAETSPAPILSPYEMAMAQVQQARKKDTEVLSKSNSDTSNVTSPSAAATAAPAVVESTSYFVSSPVRPSEPQPFTSANNSVKVVSDFEATPPPPMIRSESPVIQIITVDGNIKNVNDNNNNNRPPPPPPRCDSNIVTTTNPVDSVATVEEVSKIESTPKIVLEPPPAKAMEDSVPSSMIGSPLSSTGYAPSSELSEFGIDDSYSYRPPTITSNVTSMKTANSTEIMAEESANVSRVNSAKPGDFSISAIIGGLVGAVGAVQNEIVESTNGNEKADRDLLSTMKSKSSEIFENLMSKSSSLAINTESSIKGELSELSVGSVDVCSTSSAIDDSRATTTGVEEVAQVEQAVEVVEEGIVENVNVEDAQSEVVPQLHHEWSFHVPEHNEFSEFLVADDTTNEEEGEERRATESSDIQQQPQDHQASSASFASVRAEVAAITSAQSTPGQTRYVPAGAVPTAFVASPSAPNASQMSFEADQSVEFSRSRSQSTDEGDGDENTLNTSSLCNEEESEQQFMETMDYTSMSVDSFNSSNNTNASLSIALSSHNTTTSSMQSIANRVDVPPRPTASSAVTNSSPNRSLSAAGATTTSPSAGVPVAHTELYRLSCNFTSHVKKRKHLEFHVTPEGGKFRATISLKQTKLHKNETSPQGSRANLVTIGVCATRELANDLCLSLAPPEWSGKKDSQQCSSCKTAFTMFSKKGHCRNCGYIVCTNCSNKNWPSTMIPSTYHDSEKYVRVCKTCQTGTEMFIKALRDGDYQSAVLMFDCANINLHYPFGIYVNNAYPVHCAAVGGNLELLKWLVDTKKCSIMEKATKKPLVYGRNNLSVLAVAAQAGHVDIMRYLVREKKCSVLEIQELSILQRALHVALEAPGPMPDYVPPKRKDNEEVLVGVHSPNVTASSHGFTTTSPPPSNSFPSHNAGVSSSSSYPPGAMNAVTSSSQRPPQSQSANNNPNRRSSIDNSNLRSDNQSSSSAPRVEAAAPQSSGIAARGLQDRENSNSSVVESNVQAYYDQSPVNVATDAPVAVGQVFTAEVIASEEDTPVAASAFLADDVVFTVADMNGVRPTRQISDRWVAVANPCDATSRSQPAAAQASPNAPLPELIVESSMPRQSNGNRWW